MLKRWRYCFMSIVCFVILVCGVVRVNINFYKMVCKDNNKVMAADNINQDKAAIKIFSGMGETSELYNLLDNSKNKNLMVFYKTDPIYLSIESNKYCLYYNDAVTQKYKSSISNMYASIKYEYSSMINNIKNCINKITPINSSY